MAVVLIRHHFPESHGSPTAKDQAQSQEPPKLKLLCGNSAIMKLHYLHLCLLLLHVDTSYAKTVQEHYIKTV